ncbi:partial GDP/UDP-N,N'-diacetylbacillosamine 2-epimerase (hydrolyzing), partial [Anaerolineae bacterium]
GTINIGDRQKGRVKAASVVDCEPLRESIRDAFRHLYSREFQESMRHVVNPYGDGSVAHRIVRVLVEYALEGILKKRFFMHPRQENGESGNGR